MPRSVFPTSIQKMIEKAYDRQVHASDCALKINGSKTAEKRGVSLSTRQVAAAYAWITMRRRA